MRSLFLLGLLLSGTLAHAQPQLAAAHTARAVSSIDSVTVYLEGALIHRSFSAQVPAGETNVLFENLTNTLEGSTVVIGLEGGLMPLSVNMLSMAWQPYGEEPYFTELTDSLNALKWESEALENELVALKEELAVLKENRQLTGGSEGLSLAQLEQISTYMRTRTLAIQRAISNTTREQKSWKDQIAEVEEKLNRYRRGIPRTKNQVSFVVRSARGQRVQGTLSYFVNQANWNAVYDVKVGNLNSDLQITYKANVYNGTYENWEGIPVKVSTATPSLNVSLPTLSVWRLSGSSNSGGGRALRMEAYTQNLVMYDAEVEPSMDLQAGASQGEAGEFAVEFTINDPVTLAGNYAQRVYELDVLSAPALYEHYAVPKLGKQVYLIARVPDWNQLNLLSGQASIYFNGRYTGQSNINIRNVRDTLEFSLGEDPQVLVSRKLEEDFTEKILIGTKVRERKGYALYVKNSRASEINIRLLDQYPISAREEIEVTLVQDGGAEVNEETGELTWNLTLPANTARQLGFTFEVVYPKNLSIGLYQNRSYNAPTRFSY